MKLSFSDEVCFGLAQARCERIHINYFRIPRTTVNEDMENNDGIPEPKKHITISPRLYCQIETFSRSQSLSLNLTLLSITKFQTSLLFPTSLFPPNFLSPLSPTSSHHFIPPIPPKLFRLLPQTNQSTSLPPSLPPSLHTSQPDPNPEPKSTPASPPPPSLMPHQQNP